MFVADRNLLRSPCQSCALCYMRVMARGDSGRVVIEVDPGLKAALYVALAADNTTLKAWFIREALRFVELRASAPLFVAAEPAPAPYRVAPDDDEAG